MNTRTDFAVAKMLGAIPSPCYDICSQFGSSAPHTESDVAREDIERLMPRLKACNSKGAHIYFRPMGPLQYTLLDDLCAAALSDMWKDGFRPCAVVETSPNNYQAWLRHSRVLSKEFARCAARLLSERYGADRNAAGCLRLGRLAGFTNCKPKHIRTDGRFPFVLLHDSSGSVFPAADRIHAEVTAILAHQNIPPEPQPPDTAQNLSPQRGRRSSYLCPRRFRELPQYAGRPAAADLAYSSAARSAGATLDEIKAALRENYLSSDSNLSRQEQYISRTVAKAFP